MIDSFVEDSITELGDPLNKLQTIAFLELRDL